MKHYQSQWINEWCGENGWTDLFEERANNYWAFPPGAVMPEPIPSHILKTIKAQKGLSWQERYLLGIAAIATLGSIGLSFFLKCPIPLVLSFSIAAVTSALLEVE